MRIVHDNKGFSLMEIILSIAIAGVMFGMVSETLLDQAETSAFVSVRKRTITDVRQTLNVMTEELQHIGTGDILDISSSRIEFYDSTGTATSYELETDGDDLAIFRGNDDVLLPNVGDFTIEYQDEDGNTLSTQADQLAASIEDTRRIKLSITTESDVEGGSITMDSLVVPREFLGYSNYQ